MQLIIKEENLKNLPMARNIYTGIGSRGTPEDVLIVMNQLSEILYKKGFILRSGNAIGADKAFETNKNPNNEIYVAKNQYNKKELILPTKEEFKIAYNYLYDLRLHKKIERLKKDYSIKLHSRNVMQILGRDFNLRSRFVFCYTKNGEKTYDEVDPDITGGTGTAIGLADKCNIPIYNLGLKEDLEYVKKFINDNKDLLIQERKRRNRPRV